MLNEYLQQVQRLLRDQKQELFEFGDLISYINRARREVAGRTECIVRIPPISGQCVTATVTNAGAGYTAPTVTISTPDFPNGELPYPTGLQATAAPIVQGGSITAVDIQVGGSGYFVPQATVTDTTGSGAAVIVNIGPVTSLQEGQERLNIGDIDLSMFPGVQSIIAVRSATMIYSNWQYSCARYSFSTYQAKIRQFRPVTLYQYIPSFFCQTEQGVTGALLFYPPPSQTYQVELHCICLPQDLLTNDSEEAIPQPWQDVIPYLACYYSFLELQNHNAARAMKQEYDEFCHRYSGYSRPGFRSNPYGRWILAALTLGETAHQILHLLGNAM